MSYVEPEVDPEPQPTAPVIQGVPEADHLAVVKENAILKALPGADLSTPLAEMFTRSYAGELTTEAIQAAALAVGVLQPETPAGETPPAADEVALQAIRDDVQRTGIIPPPTAEELAAAVHPSDDGFKVMRERIDGGLPRPDAAAAWINTQVAAAMSGDERALAKEWTPDQLAGRAPAMRAPGS